MQINIFNGFTLKDICINYVSLEFERYYRGIGSFTLVLNSLDEASKFSIGDYIMLNTDTYIVENIHKFKNADKSIEVEITGNHLKSILQRRVVRAFSFDTTVSYEQASNQLVTENFISSENADRNIENMIVVDSAVQTFPNTTISLEKLSVASMLNTFLSYQQLGYDLMLDIVNKQYVFKVLQPTDKRNSVYFSEMFGNVSECDYYNDITSEKNVCYIFTDDSTQSESIGSGTGIDRKEMFVEGQYNSDLSSNKAVESANVALLETDMYTYRKDYDVGTIVTYFDKTLNISTSKQINSITEYYSDVKEIEINIGDFVPTIFDKILKKMKGA